MHDIISWCHCSLYCLSELAVFLILILFNLSFWTKSGLRDDVSVAAFLQAYSVEEILTNFSKNNRGVAIVRKLKQGEYYTREERVVMIKVLGKFLMSNCTV